jgi:hypothetical protein
MLEDLIPLLSVGMIFLIPIVAILTKHQQKMAVIFREQQLNNPSLSANNSHEIAQMKELLAQQMIAIDNLAQSQRELALAIRNQNTGRDEDLRERVGRTSG